MNRPCWAQQGPTNEYPLGIRIKTLYDFVIPVVVICGRNGSPMGRGCPPTTPRHFWVTVGNKQDLFSNSFEQKPDTHDTDFVWEIMKTTMGNNANNTTLEL